MPVDPFLLRIALLLPSFGLMTQRLDVWYPPIQALLRYRTELDFGDVQPTAMLGGIVQFQMLGQTPCFLWRERLI